MKKICVIMVAFALLMGFSQCKKEQPNNNEDPVPVLEGKTYNITLTLGGYGNDKVIINPNDDADIAPVTYEKYDEIWVAYDGKHCGTLTCSGPSSELDQNNAQLGVFTGTITVTENGSQPLYFYFLGNKTTSDGLTIASGNTGYTVDISDQSTTLPVISYAASEQTFPSENDEYTVKYNWLLNQCALVKFTMENIYDMSPNTNDNNPDAIYTTDKPITIYGMDNQVTIDLASNAFTWGTVSSSNGAIKLYKPATNGDKIRYAIVHHGSFNTTEGALDVEFNPATDPYGFYGTYKIQGVIPQNDYFQDAKIDLVWHSGAFSISATQKAYFSRGNLQYKDYDGTWRFAKHQYDYVGGYLGGNTPSSNRIGNVVLQEDVQNNTLSDNRQIGVISYQGWIDLYGWGCGARPTFDSHTNSDYTGNIIVGSTNYWHNYPYYVDFGNNNISNSGKPNNNTWWSTLTGDEWKYLADTRTDHDSKIAYGRIQTGTDEYVNGLILLPDNWTGVYTTETGVMVGTSWGDHAFDQNTFATIADWMKMESYGAVFLPAAGYRQEGITYHHVYDGGVSDKQNRGCYWAADLQGHDAAWGLGFGAASGANMLGDGINAHVGYAPDNGRSVRLVHKESSSKFFGKN